MAVETAPVCGQSNVMKMVSDATLKAQGQFQKSLHEYEIWSRYKLKTMKAKGKLYLQNKNHSWTISHNTPEINILSSNSIVTETEIPHYI